MRVRFVLKKPQGKRETPLPDLGAEYRPRFFEQRLGIATDIPRRPAHVAMSRSGSVKCAWISSRRAAWRAALTLWCPGSLHAVMLALRDK